MITESLQKKVDQYIRLLQYVQQTLDEYASRFKS